MEGKQKLTKLALNGKGEPIKIGILGLGYVGLPLAVEFSRFYPVVGFDVNGNRINELQSSHDVNNELSSEDIAQLQHLNLTNDIADVSDCDVVIITVPTPIDSNNEPDITALKSACSMVNHLACDGRVFIFESTVYPGLTEEVCVPLLEAKGNRLNHDFFVGYSPERINPGDTEHTVTKIVKVVSGSNENTLNLVDNLYSSIVTVGTHRAPSIKVAEMAKVIENIQRDVNIALINEIALISKRLDIDTHEVLQAANTKWNFLNFRPGMVGGHCISVDPYYLMHKVGLINFTAKLITVGRETNDKMMSIVASEINEMAQGKASNILILGASFKANCNDIRNSRAIDVASILNKQSNEVEIYDPLVTYEVSLKDGLSITSDVTQFKPNSFDIIALLVPHDEFLHDVEALFAKLLNPNGMVYDFPNCLPRDKVDKWF